MTQSLAPLPVWQPLTACVSAPAQIRPRVCAAWRMRFYSAIFFILTAVHTLLPIERGFPVIRLAEGYPVTLTMLVSFLCFLCLVIESAGTIFQSRTPKGYLQWQSLFTSTLIVAAITSPAPRPAFFVVLNYFICFILNFFTLRYLFTQGNLKILLAIVCLVVSAAAVVGLMERLFGYYLPFYIDFFRNFDYAQMEYAMSQTGANFRVLGTLGNPILHAVVVSLALPFALSLTGPKGWWFRCFKWVSVVLLFISVLLAASMTGAAMIGFYILGMLASYARRIRVLTLIACGLLGVVSAVWIASGSLADTAAPFQRALFGDKGNIQARLEMIDLGLSKVLNFDDIPALVTGRGLKTSSELVMTDGVYGSTLDNVWLTIAYEAGIPAVVFYILLHIAVLYQLRRFMWTAQWWAILGWYAAGSSFVTIYYATTNFLWVALVAWLWTREDRRHFRSEGNSALTVNYVDACIPRRMR